MEDGQCFSGIEEDLAELEVKVQKTLSLKKSGSSGWVYISIAGMQQAPWYYTESEAQEVAKRAEACGSSHWIPDEQFPEKKELADIA